MRYRYLRFPEGKTKAVTFSYDDGVKADKRLAQIFDKYGMKGTFNINSNRLKAGNDLTVDEVKECLIARGHEVAVHGENHIAPAAVRKACSLREVFFGRLGLEELLDMTVRGMAYPDSGIRRVDNGNSVEAVKAQLRDMDIAYARTLGGDNNGFQLPTDFHEWMPTAHHDNPKIYEYIDEFLAINIQKGYCSALWPRLFYIWGHSFEFDRKNNWEHIEEICKRLGGKEDTWYATNIEIYDYVKAYESLVVSLDGSRVYNPTLIKVWFNDDGVLYSVNPGEHIRVD